MLFEKIPTNLIAEYTGDPDKLALAESIDSEVHAFEFIQKYPEDTALGIYLYWKAVRNETDTERVERIADLVGTYFTREPSLEMQQHHTEVYRMPLEDDFLKKQKLVTIITGSMNTLTAQAIKITSGERYNNARFCIDLFDAIEQNLSPTSGLDAATLPILEFQRNVSRARLVQSEQSLEAGYSNFWLDRDINYNP